MITLNALRVLKAAGRLTLPAIRTGIPPGITRFRPHTKRANVACYGTSSARGPSLVSLRLLGHQHLGSIPVSGASASGGLCMTGRWGQLGAGCHGWRAWLRTSSRQSADGGAWRSRFTVPLGSAATLAPCVCWLGGDSCSAASSCLACWGDASLSRTARGLGAGHRVAGSLSAGSVPASGASAETPLDCAGGPSGAGVRGFCGHDGVRSACTIADGCCGSPHGGDDGHEGRGVSLAPCVGRPDRDGVAIPDSWPAD